MDIKRATDHRAMPWANGRGTTLELVVHPAGATMATMEWRLSVATVAEPGPFSALPGVDRVLLMLDDREAVLGVDGREVPLRRFDAVAFSGDTDVALTSVTGPARDLNLMTRRGTWHGGLTVLDLAAPLPRSSADERWLLVVTGTASLDRGGRRETLGAMDLVRLEDGDTVDGAGDGVLVEISREAGRPSLA